MCKESCIFPDTTFTFHVIKTGSSGIPAFNDTTAAVSPQIKNDSVASGSIVTAGDTGDIVPTSASVTQLEPGCGKEDSGSGTGTQSIWGIFIAGMLGGFLALLTPCVFPMIPMTVSFFTKRSGSKAKGIRNAIIYALSIIFIYVTLGFLVTITFGSDALNDLASNAFFNMAFFIIFVIFAISFFGAFEITLPSSIINKADSASDRGGLLGIFFMAFTLSLVSFSCTGPIIGTLLVEAAHGRSYLGPVAGMTGFSLALAIPFALFSLFPGWLSNLPKSGGWLNTVKVSLGFIELALAFKFLSNVDLAYHWGFLQRELFVAIWVIIFGLLGIYLLGKLRLSHDSEVIHISVGRMIFGML
ncbi:MAG TPA: cytochrome c biogenesis protein CcdA, partial [Bacteroidia bacterium]|nr:cytochrome c biogenesis protein CcdA [Bacteroidia bacterium]